MKLKIPVSIAIIYIVVASVIGEETAPLPHREVALKNPPCVRMHRCIEKYSEEFRIPKSIAYGVAYHETRYQGALHWDYDHRKSSGAGALGPMQVMYSTAKWLFPKENFSREDLKNDIDFNVKCSMKLLRNLHDKYKDWKKALGAYNTGRPVVNTYANSVYNFNSGIDASGK